MTGKRGQRALQIAAMTGLLLALGAAPAHAGTLLPERGGSPNADRIASLYAFVLVLAGIVFVGVTVALAIALIRYRASRSPVAAQIRGHTRLEIAWTTAAFALIVVIAAFSITKFHAIDNPDAGTASAESLVGLHAPADSMHIQVVGRQYIWMFKYPNGAFSYQELVAPVGVNVKLDITSIDVAHSWWIPKLGGKFDAIPGYTSHTWFRIERPGVYRGQCAELCGRGHADMTAQVRGVSPAAYVAWVARQKRLLAAANAAVAHTDNRP